MSEQRPPYMEQTPEDHTYQIRDEASPRDFYSQLPNLVDIMELSPHAYRLYGHLRKVAGESGKCWQSTKTLALACDMSTGKVSESKAELENVYPPLIRIESKSFDKGAYHEIAITDIWEINHRFWNGEEITIKTAKGKAFHNMNDWRSQYELLRSQYETKNNPIKNNTLTTTTPEPVFEIDTLSLNAQSLYTAITQQITFPTSWDEKYQRALSDVLTGYFGGEIGKAAESGKPVFAKYCNTRGENGIKYRPTGTGWLDWWQAELAPVPEGEGQKKPARKPVKESLDDLFAQAKAQALAELQS